MIITPLVHLPCYNHTNRVPAVPQPIQKCKRTFQALINISLEELCETAESLMAPVRMGIARPTAPFALVSAPLDAISGSEELFSVEPLPRRNSGDETPPPEVAAAQDSAGKNMTLSFLDVSSCSDRLDP